MTSIHPAARFRIDTRLARLSDDPESFNDRHKNFCHELSPSQAERLDALSEGLDRRFDRDPGLDRYNFYRRHGAAPKRAYEMAVAWVRNAIDQRNRRLGHETGAEGWHMVGKGAR